MQGKGEVGHHSRWMAKNICIKGLWFDSHLGVYDNRKEGTKAGRDCMRLWRTRRFRRGRGVGE